MANTFASPYYLDLSAGSNGSGTSGSPWNSFANAVTGLASTTAGPTKVFVKGSQTLSGALAISPVYSGSTAVTATTPVWWCGTDPSWTDLGNTGGTGTKPTLTCSTYQVTIPIGYQYFTNLSFTSAYTGSGGCVYFIGVNCRVIRCRLVGTAANANCMPFQNASTSNTILALSYFSATSTASWAVGLASGLFVGNVVIGGVSGIYNNAVNSVTAFNIFSSQASYGIQATSTIGFNTTCFNTIYNSGTDSIRITSVTGGGAIFGNAISNGTANTNGINSSAGTNGLVTVFGNGFYQQTNLTSGLVDPSLNFWPISDTAPSFVAPGSNNFQLATGSAFRQAGLPGAFEDISLLGYPDLGAVQSQKSGPTYSSY